MSMEYRQASAPQASFFPMKPLSTEYGTAPAHQASFFPVKPLSTEYGTAPAHQASFFSVKPMSTDYGAAPAHQAWVFQRYNHEGDHSSNNSTQQYPVTTNTSALNNARNIIEDCFNNYDDGTQDYRFVRISGSEFTNSFNNDKSGFQVLFGANVNAYSFEGCFNNRSLNSQSFRGARMEFGDTYGNSNAGDNRAALRRAFNNCRRFGIQNYDEAHFILGKNNCIVRRT